MLLDRESLNEIVEEMEIVIVVVVGMDTGRIISVSLDDLELVFWPFLIFLFLKRFSEM